MPQSIPMHVDQEWEILVSVPGLWIAGERVRIEHVSEDGLVFFRFTLGAVPREDRAYYTGPLSFGQAGEMHLLRRVAQPA